VRGIGLIRILSSGKSRLLIMCTELHFYPAPSPVRRPVTCLISIVYQTCRRWFKGCNSPSACASRGTRLECQLTTLFSDTTIQAAAPIDARPPRKKRGWLPLLTVLFCLSYGLMTMLIVEQGATIESQRALIEALFHDSTELSATKMKALREKRALQSKTPGAKAQDQAPSNQTPSTQAQSQAPSSQAAPVQNPASKGKSQFRMPSRPAADISDSRRTLVTI
jgi:hypothetical protein